MYTTVLKIDIEHNILVDSLQFIYINRWQSFCIRFHNCLSSNQRKMSLDTFYGHNGVVGGE